MEQFTQLVLPGSALRLILSTTWSAPDRPCVIRATVDQPSDAFTSQFVGTDTEGIMTVDEWESACYTLLSEAIATVREMVEPSLLVGLADDVN